MSRVSVIGKALGIAAGLALVVGMSTSTVFGQNKNFRRLTAFPFAFGAEISTSAAPAANGSGGLVIFNRVVSYPKGYSTLFITMSSAGDEHSTTIGAITNGTHFGCQVNGVACNPGGGGSAGSPTGWTAVLNASNDFHDDSLITTWCVRVPTGPNSVLVTTRLGAVASTVFVEHGHVYVDASNTPCI